MSNEFINKEIDEIMEDKAFEFPQNSAMSSAWILGNFKGTNLKVLKMSKDFSLTDFFVIGSAQNSTQSKAMADEICFQLKRFMMNLMLLTRQEILQQLNSGK